MGPRLWLFPDADPVGPWARGGVMLAHLPANRLPLLVFRAEPDAPIRSELDGLGVEYYSLGKKGLNPVATWWKLRSFLRKLQSPRVHVWDLEDLTVGVLAANDGCQVSCEVSEGRVPPRIFRWWKQGLNRVSHWYCQGRSPWVDPGKVKEVRGWVRVSSRETPAPRMAPSDLSVLLVADSPRAVREGLWAFDIFKHAWPGAGLKILASPSTQKTARKFSGTLGLGAGIQFLQRWSEAEAHSPVLAVVVLGSGPWTGDSALRALSWGVPVLAEESGPVRRAIAQGAPLHPVPGGDRAGLAAALQKLAVAQKEGGPRPFTFPSHLCATFDLPFYSDDLD